MTSAGGETARLSLSTVYSHDAFGNVTSEAISGVSSYTGATPAPVATRTTLTEWGERDSAGVVTANNGRFPVKVTNALLHVEERSHVVAFGEPSRVVDINGLVTTWAYDGFGRPVLESRADGSTTTISYNLCAASCSADAPAGAVHDVNTDTSGAPESTTFLDRLGREVRSSVEGFDGTTIYTDTVYDGFKRIGQISRPYFSGDTPLWTVRTYDSINRLLTETKPDAGVTSIGYNGLTTTTTNALSQASTKALNARGDTAQVIDANAQTVNYRYDPFGNLIKTTDPASNVITLSYDTLGRKVSMDDPDMGQWIYGYNAFGELIEQTDAKSQSTTMDYDSLGRMVSRTELEGTTTWTYDNKNTGVGQVGDISGPGQSESLSYDTLGRVSQISRSVFGTTKNTDLTYDTEGRLLLTKYPDPGVASHSRLIVKREYTTTGYLASIKNDVTGQVYWLANAQDVDGNVTNVTLGNGLTTERTYQTDTGLVDTIKTYSSGNSATPDIQNQSYTFDTLGNLTQRIDSIAVREEDFGYDPINRLTSTTLLDATAQSTISTKSYTYDALGNILTKSDVTGTYLYGQNGAGPHAITTAGGNAYTYDTNGNMTTGAGRTVGWSSFNKPISLASVTATSTFDYGHDRKRIRQVLTEGATSTTTRYFGEEFEQVEVTGQPIEYRHFLFANKRIGIYTLFSNETQKTRYLHTDHLGSNDTITDDAGVSSERLAYDPHGKRRETNWQDAALPIVPSETARGFTDHEHIDALELVHMNGRVYEPTLGRFLSPDPFVQYPETTQGFNRYSYVNNNPLSFTDPSGFEFEGSGGFAAGDHDIETTEETAGFPQDGGYHADTVNVRSYENDQYGEPIFVQVALNSNFEPIGGQLDPSVVSPIGPATETMMLFRMGLLLAANDTPLGLRVMEDPMHPNARVLRAGAEILARLGGGVVSGARSIGTGIGKAARTAARGLGIQGEKESARHSLEVDVTLRGIKEFALNEDFREKVIAASADTAVNQGAKIGTLEGYGHFFGRGVTGTRLAPAGIIAVYGDFTTGVEFAIRKGETDLAKIIGSSLGGAINGDRQ